MLSSMNRFANLAFLLLIAAPVAACEKSLTTLPVEHADDRRPATPEPEPEKACETDPFVPSRACVPSVVRSGSPVSIAVDQPNGCFGCGAAITRCEVPGVDHEVRVRLSMRSRPLTAGTGCAAVGHVPAHACTIPPLNAGDH